jgi:DNA-binding response OmpR family regulator
MLPVAKPHLRRPARTARALVALGDSAYAAEVEQALLVTGWEVSTARTGPELRKLALAEAPGLVILDAELPGESGWLTCEKLVRAHTPLPVVLVDGEITPHREDFARFCGAVALVDRTAGVAALLEEIDFSPDLALATN